MRLPFFLAPVFACLLPLSLSWAQESGIPDGAVEQTPQSIAIDYAVEADGSLYMKFKTSPPITGCGSMTEWEFVASADYESIDMHFGPYAFMPAPQTKKCSGTYKAASVESLFTSADLTDIKRLRLWYGDQMDTIVLQRGGRPADLTLGAVGTPKLFTIAKKLGERPKPKPEPAPKNESPAAEAEAVDLTNIILLSTGEDAADKILATQIREMAITRGFEPTANPDLFFDKTGQYYKRLATETTIEVGAIMIQGQRVPIYGVRIDQGQKK